MLINVLLVHYTNNDGQLDPGEQTGLVKGYTNEVDALDAYDKLTSIITPGDGVDSYELRDLFVKEHSIS